jgi:hypothetical protein
MLMPPVILHAVNFVFILFSEYKQQIVANLGNFAYDPINYEFIRRLNILDLFLGW